MYGDAFTAGTVPGGLNSTTDINMLICVVLYRTNVLHRDDIFEAVAGTGSANYFETADALNDLEQKGNVHCDINGYYSLTATGREICETLENDLPLTVREKVIAEASRLADFRRKSVTNKTKIDTVPAGGYRLTGTVTDSGGNPDFEVRIILPTKDSAEKAASRFVTDAETLERRVIELLMDEKMD